MEVNIKTKFNIGDKVQFMGCPELRGTIDTIKISKFRETAIEIRYLFNVFESDERGIELVK